MNIKPEYCTFLVMDPSTLTLKKKKSYKFYSKETKLKKLKGG